MTEIETATLMIIVRTAVEIGNTHIMTALIRTIVLEILGLTTELIHEIVVGTRRTRTLVVNTSLTRRTLRTNFWNFTWTRISRTNVFGALWTLDVPLRV
jgi:hypothetical protein